MNTIIEPTFKYQGWIKLPGVGGRFTSIELAPVPPGWYWFLSVLSSVACLEVRWECDVLWLGGQAWVVGSKEYTHYAHAIGPPCGLPKKVSAKCTSSTTLRKSHDLY